MPSKSLAHSTGISLGDSIVGCTNASFSSVASISNNHLSSTQHALELCPEDTDIRPSTTGKGSMRPYDISGLDADTNLVAESSLLKLVRVPPFAPRCLLIDLHINPINSQRGRTMSTDGVNTVCWGTSNPVKVPSLEPVLKADLVVRDEGSTKPIQVYNKQEKKRTRQLRRDQQKMELNRKLRAHGRWSEEDLPQ